MAAVSRKPVAGLVLGVLVLVACAGLDPAVEASVVWSVDRPGEFVFRDERLSEAMVGDRVLDEGVVATAACHSLLGHAGDWGVRPHAIVSSRLDLVRVAELVSEGLVDRSVAEQVEAVLFSGAGSVDDVAGLASASGLTREAVADYLEARSLPASPAALDRFAVYVQNRKRDVQRLVVVDRDVVAAGDFDGMPSQYGSVPFVIAGDPDEYEYDRDDCERLV